MQSSIWSVGCFIFDQQVGKSSARSTVFNRVHTKLATCLNEVLTTALCTAYERLCSVYVGLSGEH